MVADAARLKACDAVGAAAVAEEPHILTVDGDQAVTAMLAGQSARAEGNVDTMADEHVSSPKVNAPDGLHCRLANALYPCESCSAVETGFFTETSQWASDR